ncbi:MAG: toxin-antitoxin system HicB family antitoxin, partial [Thiothrix sp.]
AKRDNVSMNQLFITAIAEKLAVLEAESLITQRAARANLDAFKKILDRVPHAAPQAGDDLPD